MRTAELTTGTRDGESGRRTVMGYRGYAGRRDRWFGRWPDRPGRQALPSTAFVPSNFVMLKLTRSLYVWTVSRRNWMASSSPSLSDSMWSERQCTPAKFRPRLILLASLFNSPTIVILAGQIVVRVRPVRVALGLELVTAVPSSLGIDDGRLEVGERHVLVVERLEHGHARPGDGRMPRPVGRVRRDCPR